jgi:major vault protein
MPPAEIEVREKRKGYVLNDFTGLHLRALKNFTDIYEIKRRAGEEWIVDKQITDVHIRDANEELVEEKKIIVLSQNQYCVVRNPVGKDGKI